MTTVSQLKDKISNVLPIPALWHIGENDDPEPFDEEEILEGDYVLYFDEDKNDYAIGIFINLWQWAHPEETSPNYGDSRVMAYIKTPHGMTYADTLHITLADDVDDFEWLRYEMSVD